MSKENDLFTFEGIDSSFSASPLLDTSQGTLHTQCNALASNASPKEGHSIVDELPTPMIHVPDVQGLSRPDLARKKQAEVQNRLSGT